MMGDGRDNLKDVGGPGTAQRGTAAALIVATQNFDDARVLIIITIVNTLGIVLLIAAAKAMARDNSRAPLPVVADPPPGRDHYARPSTLRTPRPRLPPRRDSAHDAAEHPTEHPDPVHGPVGHAHGPP
jgi:hypothetical protein